LLASLYSIVPVLEWLPRYSIKENLIGDITAGVTVAVMHIPQGMAFSMLSTVEPIVGLYMAFFHSLIYFVFGTSRHLSVGTFAVVSLMVANIISGINTGSGMEQVGMGNSTSEIGAGSVAFQYTPIQIAAAVSMVVGIYQIVMSIFRMGALSSLLSDPLVKAFTTAAAIHVIVSQLKDLLGLKIPPYKGAFNIVFTIIALFENLGNTNLVSMTISFLVIVFMLLTNDYLKVRETNGWSIPH
jgi:solute carrier family 26, other